MNYKLTSLFLLFLVACTSVTQGSHPGWNSSIESFVNDMEKTYGVQVEFEDPSKTSWDEESIHFRKLEKTDATELTKYIGIFRAEFFKYSLSFIKNTHLKKVIFVKELYNSGVPVAAMPDYYQEYLYIDIFEGNSDELYQRHVIHHEFYHMIEEQFNGDAYYKDPAWAKFNASTFVYGNGGINNRTGDMRPVTHPDAGFISLYSETGLEEDKAEIFAALMTDDEKKVILPWTKSDPILKNKVNFMVAFIGEYDQIITIH